MPEDRLPVLWSGDVAVVRMPGEIDVTNSDKVRDDLLATVNQGASAIVLDMSRTTFCDSSGVSALVRTHRRATAAGAGLRLATSSDVVLRVFSLVGLTQVIDVYPDVQAALGSLARDARREDRQDASPGPRPAADPGPRPVPDGALLASPRSARRLSRPRTGSAARPAGR